MYIEVRNGLKSIILICFRRSFGWLSSFSTKGTRQRRRGFLFLLHQSTVNQEWTTEFMMTSELLIPQQFYGLKII